MDLSLLRFADFVLVLAIWWLLWFRLLFAGCCWFGLYACGLMLVWFLKFIACLWCGCWLLVLGLICCWNSVLIGCGVVLVDWFVLALLTLISLGSYLIVVCGTLLSWLVLDAVWILLVL